MWKPTNAVGLGLVLLLLAGCNRNLEPFDPNEKPRQPDLSKIFPAGSEGPGISENAPTEMPPPPGMEGGAEAGDEGGEPIRGTLRVAPELASSLPAGAVLFLIARTAAPGPPLAVKRIESPHFPLDFEIGPDDRMIKSRPFVGPLRITARLDSDGNATSRTPGDLQGESKAPVSPGATGVELVLDERL